MTTKGAKRPIMPSQKKFEEYKFTDEEHIAAKALYESMYPDARWENLHPNRDIRFARLVNARAMLNAVKIQIIKNSA